MLLNFLIRSKIYLFFLPPPHKIISAGIELKKFKAFTIDRDVFLKSLANANGIIEKKATLPILSNILIEAKESKIKITATDLDIIYFEEIMPQEIKQEGSTTTSANILYDILRKLQPNSKLELNLLTNNNLKLASEIPCFFQ